MVVGHRTETKTQNVLKFYSSAKKSEWPKTWEGFVLKGKAKEHVDSATGNVIPVRQPHTLLCLALVVPALVWLPCCACSVPSGEGAHTLLCLALVAVLLSAPARPREKPRHSLD